MGARFSTAIFRSPAGVHLSCGCSPRPCGCSPARLLPSLTFCQLHKILSRLRALPRRTLGWLPRACRGAWPQQPPLHEIYSGYGICPGDPWASCPRSPGVPGPGSPNYMKSTASTGSAQATPRLAAPGPQEFQAPAAQTA